MSTPRTLIVTVPRHTKPGDKLMIEVEASRSSDGVISIGVGRVAKIFSILSDPKALETYSVKHQDRA